MNEKTYEVLESELEDYDKPIVVTELIAQEPVTINSILEKIAYKDNLIAGFQDRIDAITVDKDLLQAQLDELKSNTGIE